MFSRRTRIVLSILVVMTLTIVILDLRGGDGPLSSVRTVGSGILGGIERVAATVFSPITGANEWWSTMRNQADQISELRVENDKLRADATTMKADEGRLASMDALLRIASAGQYKIVPAEIIAVGPAQDFTWSVTIDAGSNDGIEADMSVINGQGLVGRVVKTTPWTSTVVLVVDTSTAVGGRVAGTDEIGIVSGTGEQDSLEFQLLDPMGDLRVGDSLVTFGSKGGRPFVPGLPIGQVTEVKGTPGQMTRVAKVRPFVDISRLSVVGVVTRPPRVDPRDTVLPKDASLPATPSPVPLNAGADASASPSASSDGLTLEPQGGKKGTATPSSTGGQ